MTNPRPAFDDVKHVLVETLGIEDRSSSFDASTQLFGSLPELDSLAVLELVTALEEQFDIVIDDSDFSGDVFETLGSLASFVDQKRMDAA
jgi:acyl carrier protein